MGTRVICIALVHFITVLSPVLEAPVLTIFILCIRYFFSVMGTLSSLDHCTLKRKLSLLVFFI